MVQSAERRPSQPPGGGAAPGRETKGERTRRVLLLAAAQLFADKGVDATSIVDITKAADVSNGTFYTYFSNKADVVAAVHHLLITEALRAPSFEDWRPTDIETSTASGVPAALQLVARDPVLGALCLRAMQPGGMMHDFALARMVEWCERAAAQGRTLPFGPHQTARMSLALMVCGMQMVLDGEPLEETQRATTESVLLVRGYPYEEAVRTAARGASGPATAGARGD